MDRASKLRVSLEVCKEYYRNVLCFELMLEKSDEDSDRFYIAITNNFYDAAILNWGHLFGNREDKLHFRNNLCDPDGFLDSMLNELEITLPIWKENWENLKSFRDKRVAHIDTVDSIPVPYLDMATKACAFYYNEALRQLEQESSSIGFERDFQEFKDNIAMGYLKRVETLSDSLKNRTSG